VESRCRRVGRQVHVSHDRSKETLVLLLCPGFSLQYIRLEPFGCSRQDLLHFPSVDALASLEAGGGRDEHVYVVN
jgi:hypothetical protein